MVHLSFSNRICKFLKSKLLFFDTHTHKKRRGSVTILKKETHLVFINKCCWWAEKNENLPWKWKPQFTGITSLEDNVIFPRGSTSGSQMHGGRDELLKQQVINWMVPISTKQQRFGMKGRTSKLLIYLKESQLRFPDGTGESEGPGAQRSRVGFDGMTHRIISPCGVISLLPLESTRSRSEENIPE